MGTPLRPRQARTAPAPLARSLAPARLPLLVGLRFSRAVPVDAVLAHWAATQVAQGVRVAGFAQDHAPGPRSRAKMRLRDLATGQTHLIGTPRGQGARGCHLDWDVMAGLATQLQTQVEADTDLLIVNRFGMAESRGQGFVGALSAAIERNIPVLVAYRDDYADAWHAFEAGLATEWGLADLPRVARAA